MNAHEQKIKTLIPIAEAAGDSRQAAYRAIAEEIDAWMKEDGTMTQTAIAQRFGKGQQWVSSLLGALTRTRVEGVEFTIDWRSGSNKRSEIVPSKLDDQVKMASELLAKPAVAEAVMRSQTPAAREMRRVVAVSDYEQSQRAAIAREERRNDGAMPIEGNYARIAQKISSWADELVWIKEDLVDGPETMGKRMVMLSLRSLGDVAHGIANDIDPDLSNVIQIEG